ncbi:hypothetical protein HPB50_002885 [Hyalomma asiaticum]|uniref:Uncharacterized protein n=1 Tax=Hyalomma asiaticum TaxID=266040 RepID=A0ACB7SBL4_HYAAI|nr:hypothetical protein HPB50_002885 [Hyalomma asiaticum]
MRDLRIPIDRYIGAPEPGGHAALAARDIPAAEVRRAAASRGGCADQRLIKLGLLPHCGPEKRQGGRGALFRCAEEEGSGRPFRDTQAANTGFTERGNQRGSQRRATRPGTGMHAAERPRRRTCLHNVKETRVPRERPPRVRRHEAARVLS